MHELSDFGPIYTETNLERFPVEPLNTVSNILFLVVALYWLRKINIYKSKDFRTYLKVSLPLLLTGYIGGTVYHATRSHVGWMLMDVVPIYFIGVITSTYHWRLIRFSLFQILGAFVFLLVIPLTILWTVVPSSPHTSTLGYLCLVIAVVAPLVIDLVKTRFRFLKEFLVPLILISMALTFRSLDSTSWVQEHFSIGTHWLWHTFGALTCYFLVRFMAERSKYQLSDI